MLWLLLLKSFFGVSSITNRNEFDRVSPIIVASYIVSLLSVAITVIIIGGQSVILLPCPMDDSGIDVVKETYASAICSRQQIGVNILANESEN